MFTEAIQASRTNPQISQIHADFGVALKALGLVAPAGILLGGGPTGLAASFLLFGIAARNHVLVQAPQRVPLS